MATTRQSALTSPLRDALSQLRLRLLDLTGRNRLLNYKHPIGKSLQFVQGPPALLYQRLVEGRTTVPIKGLPEPTRSDLVLKAGRWSRPDVREWAIKHKIPTTHELAVCSPDDEAEPRTLMYSDDLAKHCRKIQREAELAIEETGANMLHLVIGFLEFPDQKDSDRVFLAPLISIPVSLGRKDHSGRQNYFLQYTGDDIEENLSLREKLRQDHNIVLPELDEDNFSLEKYLSQIGRATKSHVGFVVRRWASLCLLSFTNMLLVRDLDPDNWPNVQGQNGLLDHQIVKKVFGTNGESENPVTTAPEDTVEGEAGLAIPLVFDADSSQHSALIDAVIHGRNLVIEGPPGTGKSQTITNLIAAAIERGKRVLFVSEKVAALEVVKKRLQAAGLDEFVLELHSTKTNRKLVLEAIERRLDLRPSAPRDLPRMLEELTTARKNLKVYSDLVNSITQNSMGLRLFEVMWRCERFRQQVSVGHAALLDLLIEDAAELSEAELSRRVECLENLGAQYSEIGAFDATCPWWGFFPRPMLAADELRVGSLVRQLSAVAASIHELACKLGDLLVARPAFVFEEALAIRGAVSAFLKQCDSKLPLHLVPRVTNSAGQCNQARAQIQQLDDLIRAYHRLGEQVIGVVTEGPALNPTCGTAIHKIINLSNRHRLPMRTTAEAHSMVDKLRECAADLTSAQARVVELSSRSGVPTPNDAKGCADTAAFVGCFSVLPSAVADHQNEALLNRGALVALTALQSLQRSITDTRSKLARSLYLDAIPDVDVLRNAALTFREGEAWYRFLQPTWRKAVSIHRSLQIDKKKIRSTARLQELHELLDLVVLERRWSEDKTWSRYLPATECRLDFDLDPVIALCKWNCEIVERGERLGVERLKDTLLDSSALQLKANDLLQLGRALDAIKPTFERAQQLSPGVQVLASPVEKAEALHSTATELESNLSQIADVVAGDVEFEQATSAIEAALHRGRIVEAVKNSESCQVLGDYFDGLNTNTSAALAVVAIAEQIPDLGIKQEFRTLLGSGNPHSKGTQLLEILEALISEMAELRQVTTSLNQFGEFNTEDWAGSKESGDLINFIQGCRCRADGVAESLGSLSSWFRYISRREEALDLTLTAFVEVLEAGVVLPAEIGRAYRYAAYNTIVRMAFHREPMLGKFSGLKHNRIRSEFQRLDREIIGLRGRDIASRCVRQAAPPCGTNGARVDDKTEMTLLYHLMPQSRPRVPLRKLFKRASRAVQALKPCFMMGPQAVSQFLSPEISRFDMVVMDEASQLKPEEAIGAIARGGQLIVVGDPKQLPPTTFFTRMAQPGEEEEQFTTTDAESILDVCLSHFQPSRRLRWHYRSQHHSLIAFSNHYFYKNLVVFPSPYGHSSRLGVRATYLPDAVYEDQTNYREAARVVDAVTEHIRLRCNESLGVVTLNLKQRDLIADLLEERLEGVPEADEFRSRWIDALQPLFVKNLETVQGDERDAIIISTTFGKPEGADAVRQNFGPISRQGGWRRLNVLFTRARKSISVYTSLRPEDIIVDGNTPEGTKALRNYLDYAQKGILSTPEETCQEPESDFEASVMVYLNRSGYEVTPQLGVAGFRIDLAVKHPDHPGAYLAGIECDGATYHSAQSVRDRDRIRQEILESMGWRGRIWRIWSTDWFRTPTMEAEKLLSFLGGLRASWKPEYPSGESWVEERRGIRRVTPVTLPVLEDDELCVRVGDTISYIDINRPGDVLTVQIVEGANDLEGGAIHKGKPLAQALLGAVEGDEVTMHLPGTAARNFKIVSIKGERAAQG